MFGQLIKREHQDESMLTMWSRSEGPEHSRNHQKRMHGVGFWAVNVTNAAPRKKLGPNCGATIEICMMQILEITKTILYFGQTKIGQTDGFN